MSAHEMEQDINSISSSAHANTLSYDGCTFSLLTFTNSRWKPGGVSGGGRSFSPGRWNEEESPHNVSTEKKNQAL